MMVKDNLTFWRVMRFAVVLLPLSAALITGPVHFWPVGVVTLLLSMAIAIAPFLEVWDHEPLTSWWLLAEVIMASFVAYKISGAGVFAPFVIATDLGFSVWSNKVLAIVDGYLGIVATYCAVGYPTRNAVMFDVVFGLVFIFAMWANSQSTRQTRALQKAYQALQHAQEQEKELIKLQERERIAQNLHDILGHSLTLIVLKAELIREHLKRAQWTASREETDSLLGIARRSLDEVRQVVETLPSYTPVFDMVNELKRAQIQTTLDWNPPVTASPGLLTDWDMILREGITNILRHAHASTVRIQLKGDNNGWTLVIEDNGTGFIQAEGHGLQGIKNRAAKWNGTVEIQSRPGQGTSLVVTGQLVEVSNDVCKQICDADYDYRRPISGA
ncbi:sensor histidine kinase [Sulfobacillus thermosulfidooxidans]|uniref:sensor histidine kinase n=1 Tax=Sulfobacillus thermosulfidooxidans TaxID=28034 RepID=UPI0019D6EE25|nr:sensor histidine kinase [Sulfobacillus thermosulfidooxidans]